MVKPPPVRSRATPRTRLHKPALPWGSAVRAPVGSPQRLRLQQRPAPPKGMPLAPRAGWLALLALAAGSARQAWALRAAEAARDASADFAGRASLHPRLRLERSGDAAALLVTGRIVKGQVSPASTRCEWGTPPEPTCRSAVAALCKWRHWSSQPCASCQGLICNEPCDSFVCLFFG